MNENYKSQGDEGKVEWNFANFLNMELAEQRRGANSDYKLRRYEDSFTALTNLKFTASHTLTDEQHNILEEIEKKVYPLLLKIKLNNSFDFNDFEKSSEAVYEFKKYYAKYNRILMDILDKNGFFGGRKKDSTSMSIGGNINDHERY